MSLEELYKIVDAFWYVLAFIMFLVACADFRQDNKQDSQIEILVAIFFLLISKL